MTIGSELSSASGSISVSRSSGSQRVTYASSSSGSYLAQPAIASSTPTQHHGAKERLEGISHNSSLNPQQEHHQSQHYPENVSLVPRTSKYTASASGSQDQRSRSNARSSAQHDTPSALQGYASSSAVSNSQQQNREYISHTESTRHMEHPHISATEDYLQVQWVAVLRRRFPCANTDILSYDHGKVLFLRIGQNSKRTGKHFTKKTRIYTLHILRCQISKI